MAGLALYDAARAALAECHRVDEAVTERNKAKALHIYAKQAKDSGLIEHATDIKLRAERRAGEILIGMAKDGERSTGGRPGENHPEDMSVPKVATLKDLEITHNESSQWQRLAKLPAPEFEKRVEDAKRGARNSIEMTREEKVEAKKERRAGREVELARKQRALPMTKHGVVYADPEWSFKVWHEVTGNDRAAANHYPTSETRVIEERDVKSICADDCVLFLWSTGPMLEHALRVLNAWGFEYKSQYVWVKPKAGTGYWARNRHETLLIGTKGNPICPAPGDQWESVIDADVGAHSEKPEIFLEMIESYYPNVPKIELNRRGGPREGWSGHGLEFDEAAE